MQRHVVASDVAAEHDPHLAATDLDSDLDERRPQNVAGVEEAHSQLGFGLELQPLVVALGAAQRQGVPGVIHGVQRQRRPMLGVALAIGVAGVLLLDLGRVEQHQLGQLIGRRRAVDRRVEPQLHQPRQVPDVIDVGVGEQHVLDRRGLETRVLPIPEPQLLEPLEETGVEQHSGLAGVQQVTRAGDRTGGTMERDTERIGHGLTTSGGRSRARRMAGMTDGPRDYHAGNAPGIVPADAQRIPVEGVAEARSRYNPATGPRGLATAARPLLTSIPNQRARS